MLSQIEHFSEARPVFRFSGHETFSCRYAWLPKAAQAIATQDNQDILTSAREDDAMVQLGVGKNMVRSIRFWAEAADVIRPAETGTGHTLTKFGRKLLVGTSGHPPLDPYLEDIQTLWLIHWKLATNKRAAIFAWDYLMNHFQEPDLYASTVVKAFRKTVTQLGTKDVTVGSLEQLYDVFIHSYVPTRGQKSEVREDSLDCPLVELGLLQPNGLIQSSLYPGRMESKFIFCREEKQEITAPLFFYCLLEFWSSRFSNEQSLPFHAVVSGHGSPGQVFKIPENDIRARLLAVGQYTNGILRFDESAMIPRISCTSSSLPDTNLENIYHQEVACA